MKERNTMTTSAGSNRSSSIRLAIDSDFLRKSYVIALRKGEPSNTEEDDL